VISGPTPSTLLPTTHHQPPPTATNRPHPKGEKNHQTSSPTQQITPQWQEIKNVRKEKDKKNVSSTGIEPVTFRYMISQLQPNVIANYTTRRY
jgi:hypothetical protein